MKVDLATAADVEMLREMLDKILSTIENNGKTSDANWIKAKQVCNILGCSPSSLTNYRRNKDLQFKKIGGTYFYNLKNSQNEK